MGFIHCLELLFKPTQNYNWKWNYNKTTEISVEAYCKNISKLRLFTALTQVSLSNSSLSFQTDPLFPSVEGHHQSVSCRIIKPAVSSDRFSHLTYCRYKCRWLRVSIRLFLQTVWWAAQTGYETHTRHTVLISTRGLNHVGGRWVTVFRASHRAAFDALV